MQCLWSARGVRQSSATRCARKALVSTETGLTASSRKSPPDTGSCASRRHQRQRALCRHARASAAQLPAGDPRSVAGRDRPAGPRPAVAAPPREDGEPARGFRRTYSTDEGRWPERRAVTASRSGRATGLAIQSLRRCWLVLTASVSYAAAASAFSTCLGSRCLTGRTLAAYCSHGLANPHQHRSEHLPR